MAAAPEVAWAIDPNPVPSVPKGDPAMLAAFARAAANLDEFLAKWRAEGFTVKIGLMDRSAAPGRAFVKPGASLAAPVEWFWTHNLRQNSDGFTAEIANDAEIVRNVSAGDTISFSRQDIADWMCFQDGKIVGDATACPGAGPSRGRRTTSNEGVARHQLRLTSKREQARSRCLTI
jgi:uncharacterized protein YegJ (DUF2314 family)